MLQTNGDIVSWLMLLGQPEQGANIAWVRIGMGPVVLAGRISSSSNTLGTIMLDGCYLEPLAFLISGHF